jgi:hypothetical protein
VGSETAIEHLRHEVEGDDLLIRGVESKPERKL